MGLAALDGEQIEAACPLVEGQLGFRVELRPILPVIRIHARGVGAVECVEPGAQELPRRRVQDR